MNDFPKEFRMSANELRAFVVQLRKQLVGAAKAQEAAKTRSVAESNRADIAERAIRDLTTDRDRWRTRAQTAEAKAASLGATVA
jgi:hypothetical protein